MNECPTCEYHKQRAQIWRDEVYKLAGHPLPRKETMTEDDDDIQDYKKPWVGLTHGEVVDIYEAVLKKDIAELVDNFARALEAKLKEKNT
jgi:hypothetical protein